MRVIDVNTLLTCETCYHHRNGGCSMFCDTGEGYRPDFNTIKVIEAEPVVYSYWMHYPDCGVTRCANCDWSIEEAWYSKYCPNCGANMEKRKEKE